MQFKNEGSPGRSEKEPQENSKETVRGVELIPEKILENKKSEIGEKAFGEYRELFSRKKNLEERLSFEETAKNLKEAIKKGRERKEAQKELSEIDKRISVLGQNENFRRMVDLESKILTSLSSDALDDATNDLEKAKIALGNDIMERIRDLEKTRRDAYKERDEKKEEIWDLQKKGGLRGLKEANESEKVKSEKVKLGEIEKKINEISRILEREDLLGFLEGKEAGISEEEATNQSINETETSDTGKIPGPEGELPKDGGKKKEPGKVKKFLESLPIVGSPIAVFFKMLWNKIFKNERSNEEKR